MVIVKNFNSSKSVQSKMWKSNPHDQTLLCNQCLCLPLTNSHIIQWNKLAFAGCFLQHLAELYCFQRNSAVPNYICWKKRKKILSSNRKKMAQSFQGLRQSVWNCFLLQSSDSYIKILLFRGFSWAPSQANPAPKSTISAQVICLSPSISCTPKHRNTNF